jgi:hypothetical protein
MLSFECSGEHVGVGHKSVVIKMLCFDVDIVQKENSINF